MKHRISNSTELPEAVKRSLGIGITKTRVFHLPDGDLVVKAVQDLGEVIIRLTHVTPKDKAKSIELSEDELRHILLMARDVRRMSGQGETKR